MRKVMAARFYRRAPLAGLERVTVRHKFSNHTVTYLDYDVKTRSQYLLPAENTLVEVQYGNSPMGVRTTYGYVNHYETVIGSDGKTLVRMVLLGSSKPLNSVDPTSWIGVTRSSVARDIAAKHKMRSVIHEHSYVVDTWTTGTRSDFQSLKALADEAGYRMWIEAATLYFLDPEKLLTTAASMDVIPVPLRSNDSVQILGGSNLPGEVEVSRRQVQFGLDYRTNEFFTATSGSEENPTTVLGSAVNTFDEAAEVAGAADRKQQDYYVLKATFDGNATIQPGSLVRVDSGRVNTDQGGLWIATEVTHETTRTTFSTQLVATRGKDQKPVAKTRSTTRGTTSQPLAVVRDGVHWEAALQEQVHV